MSRFPGFSAPLNYTAPEGSHKPELYETSPELPKSPFDPSPSRRRVKRTNDPPGKAASAGNTSSSSSRSSQAMSTFDSLISRLVRGGSSGIASTLADVHPPPLRQTFNATDAAGPSGLDSSEVPIGPGDSDMPGEPPRTPPASPFALTQGPSFFSGERDVMTPPASPFANRSGPQPFEQATPEMQERVASTQIEELEQQIAALVEGVEEYGTLVAAMREAAEEDPESFLAAFSELESVSVGSGSGPSTPQGGGLLHAGTFMPVDPELGYEGAGPQSPGPLDGETPDLIEGAREVGGAGFVPVSPFEIESALRGLGNVPSVQVPEEQTPGMSEGGSRLKNLLYCARGL